MVTAFLATMIVVSGMSLVYQFNIGILIRNSIFALLFSFGLVFVFCYSTFSDKFEYDNIEHPYRFLIVYLAGLILSSLFPLIDIKGWFFLCIVVAVALFSNGFMAFYCASGFIMLSVLLSQNANLTTVFVYLISSFVAILLFQDIDQNFTIGLSFAMSALCLFALETAGFIFLENRELSAEQFVMPIVNIAINCIVLFFCLKYFNERIANRYRNKYLEINDQEYKALIQLKEVSKEEYFRSIHTAYLTERMAQAIGCDVDVAKNCAYYHRIKKAFDYSDEDCRKFVEENQFPPKAATALTSFLDKDSKLVEREAGIVYISDKLISTLMTVFAKDSKATLNYEELIDTLFEKDYFKKALSDSMLSVRDFKTIREIFLKETLYYDFLR